MILNGTEEKRNIWTDTPYSLANATWYGHRKLVRNATHWFACFDRYGDEDYSYQTVVMKSTDGVNWENTGFPFTPNGGVSFAYPNMAVDASGRIHLCASDNTNNTIKYCVYENDAWGFVETLPSLPGGGYVDADIIVLVDSAEKPHVVFATGGSTGKVYYSNKVSGTWNAYEAVQPTVTRYYLDSTVIDKNDNIHICMVSMTDYFIYYSKGKAGAWSPWEKVFDGYDANGSDIGVDSAGKPYVVLARGTEVSLYSKNTSWTGQQISSMPNNIHPNIHISDGDQIYLSWGQSPTEGYNNQQIFFCSNEGCWSQPVNITRDDTLSGWAYSVVWADATVCGVMAMNYDYTHICGWFAGGTPATYFDKWGTLRLNLTQYNRNEIGQLATEKSLIPYIRITAPQSRLISTGQSRERRSVGGWATKEDFDQIENDYETFAKKKAEFHDGTIINTAIIEELSAMRQKGTQAVYYEITFLEV